MIEKGYRVMMNVCMYVCLYVCVYVCLYMYVSNVWASIGPNRGSISSSSMSSGSLGSSGL